jgi:hypothetical protein
VWDVEGVRDLSRGISNVLWCRICGMPVIDAELHLMSDHTDLYVSIRKAKDKKLRDGLVFFTANKPKGDD